MRDKPAHRPTLFSEDLAAEICGRIADGQSVREIARADDMPNAATIFRWLPKHDDFREQYEIAVEARLLHLADELINIADGVGSGDGEVQRACAGPGSGV